MSTHLDRAGEAAPDKLGQGQFLKSEGNRLMAGLRPIEKFLNNIMNGFPLGQKNNSE